jgi:hypothetical protein
MPQLSFADRLIMAANYMAYALKHPHPDVPFNAAGDETISALITLSAIFKRKYNNIPAQHLIDPSIKAAENKRPAVLIQSVLTSPIKHTYQTRSQTQVNTIPASEYRDSSQLRRVVNPATRIAAPPRVPARMRNVPPRNLPQGYFWDMGSANNAIPLGKKHWKKNQWWTQFSIRPQGRKCSEKDIMQHQTLGQKYKTSFGNELGRLCRGIIDIQGTNTCFFVELSNIPKDRRITYGKLVCDHKPNKAEKEWVRLTVGGNMLDYTGEVASSTADITTFKILINSTISTKDAKMMIMDTKNYYVGTPLPRYEYMWLSLSIIPDEIITKYNLGAISVGGWVYLNILKYMYGLKHAGLFANQLLKQRLAPYGYYPARYTPALWLYKTRSIVFTLVVHDFAVKYVGQENAHHFRNALLRHYEITTDWGGTVYSGMILKWDYRQRTCEISMPCYITNVLKKIQHDTPKHPQQTPSKYVIPIYGTKTQYATRDETPLLSAKQCTNILNITGSVLYYAREVDPMVIMPLNDIPTEQTKAT